MSTRRKLAEDSFPASFGLGIVLWKHLLEGIFEGQVEGLGGEVAQAVGEVAIPEAIPGSCWVLQGQSRCCVWILQRLPLEITICEIRVGQITSFLGENPTTSEAQALLFQNALSTIHHARVTRHFSTADPVGVIGVAFSGHFLQNRKTLDLMGETVKPWFPVSMLGLRTKISWFTAL